MDLESGLDPVTQPEYESEASSAAVNLSCPGSSACMAVGYYSEGSKGTNGLLGQYWNGSTWGPELPENQTQASNRTCSTAYRAAAPGVHVRGVFEISATTSRIWRSS